jgi:hypothetical protein
VASMVSRRAELVESGDLIKPPMGKASVHDPWASTATDPLDACRVPWTVPAPSGVFRSWYQGDAG